MERPLTNFAGASGLRGIYRVRVADVRSLDDINRQHRFWDKLLGVLTMVGVSAAGWAGIFELIRLLK
jgi:hypothetical protein